MAHDYEDIHDIDDLSDDELTQLVREWLAGNDSIDADDVMVSVEDGVVRLSGRVGTEGELRIAERLVTDSLGIVNVENELVVDAIRRADSPEAIDDHLADEAERSGTLLGDVPRADSPEAEHLTEDHDAMLFGTVDLQKAIERGGAWNPPSSPTPEGLSGTDASPSEMGEDH
jgi:hypothetical protein